MSFPTKAHLLEEDYSEPVDEQHPCTGCAYNIYGDCGQGMLPEPDCKGFAHE